MKCKIKKNTVQETLILPLYPEGVYGAAPAVTGMNSGSLLDEVPISSQMAEKNSRSLAALGAMEVAMRQSDLAFDCGITSSATPVRRMVILGWGWTTRQRLRPR